MLIPTGRTVFTVMVIVLDVAGEPVAHVRLLVITQLTLLPLAKVVVKYVGLFDPTLAPFTFHWYVGIPPLIGVAVNVTPIPEQMVVAEAAMLTLTVSGGPTTMVI